MSNQLIELAILLNPADNVAIARQTIPAGTPLADEGQNWLTRQAIPSGHKLARAILPKGQPVIRYGQVIGFASRDILPGDWVHSHNLEVGDMQREFDVQVAPLIPPTPLLSPKNGERKGDETGNLGVLGCLTAQNIQISGIFPFPQMGEGVRGWGDKPPPLTFLGFRREDGRVGTRNYIAVISTVNCANQSARQIADTFKPERLAEFPNVDGVVAIVHTTGCCAPPDSLSYRYLQRTLLHLAEHPNVGGAIFVSLGCEGNQIQKDSAAFPNPIPSSSMLTIQELGGIRGTVRAGVAAVEQLLPIVNSIRRTPQPISALVAALQCGGSDGWSGVTANPLVGRVADALVDSGGTVVLAETPEIFGAEQLLTRRAADAEAGRRLIERIQWWQAHAAHEGFSLDNNPSPGNKAGGLTTIYEKSLGAVAKGGSRPLQAVYEYAERITRRGLVFMDTPGYDPVSVTGQVAGGSTLVLFTTGRGSVFGGLIAPCIKIATNTATYQRMQEDMDFNAGVLLEGTGFEAASQALLDLVSETASGRTSKSETSPGRESEFIPWQPGGIL
jgi:altronate hydrolase